MSDTPDKKRTITMTDRPPVTIKESEWPIVAVGYYAPKSHGPGMTPRPKYEYDEHTMRVRQHEDGRAIVYAVLEGATAWTGTEDHRGGVLLPTPTISDIAEAIRKVGESCGLADQAIRECIADLSAEEI